MNSAVINISVNSRFQPIGVKWNKQLPRTSLTPTWSAGSGSLSSGYMKILIRCCSLNLQRTHDEILLEETSWPLFSRKERVNEFFKFDTSEMTCNGVKNMISKMQNAHHNHWMGGTRKESPTSHCVYIWLASALTNTAPSHTHFT